MNSPFILVIFGATGDLAQNKLVPALFSLYEQGHFTSDFFVVGFSRRDLSDEDFRNYFSTKGGSSSGRQKLKKLRAWREFSKNLYYQKGDFNQRQGYSALVKKLEAFDKKIGACITRFFYLATPPQNYETILDFLESTKLSEGCGHPSQTSSWTRIIIEKPFGKDLETAISLDKKLSQSFDEKQIFRVDHYLGKETVQNMIAFRFANGVFEPVWNRNFIDHVQITFAEKEGIGGRGQFFDGVGILRDVGQNHLMQLLGAVAMEQPRSFSKEDMRDSRAQVVKAINGADEASDGARLLDRGGHERSENWVVRGQYRSYRKEEDVGKNSNTETFVAMKLFVDTDRFKGVPFYLRAGKKMPKDLVEINIVFIQTCHILFKEYGCPEIGNVLTIRIQPDEGIGLRVIAKKPGAKVALDTVNMKFSYRQEFGGKVADAYEKILLDIFAGDQMLFNRSDELASSWRFITNILRAWGKEKPNFPNYRDNTWGPKEAFELIEKDSRKWIV